MPKVKAKYLYRGVNADLYRTTNGELKPKAAGQKFRRAVYYGENVYFGNGSVYGESERNAVIMHQRDSSKHPTSGVSMTPIFENAKRYATHGPNGKKYERGHVFKIDTTLLEEHGVTAFPVEDHAVKPAIPTNTEVILVARDHGVLPRGIVVEVIDVTLS